MQLCIWKIILGSLKKPHEWWRAASREKPEWNLNHWSRWNRFKWSTLGVGNEFSPSKCLTRIWQYSLHGPHGLQSVAISWSALISERSHFRWYIGYSVRTATQQNTLPVQWKQKFPFISLPYTSLPTTLMSILQREKNFVPSIFSGFSLLDSFVTIFPMWRSSFLLMGLSWTWSLTSSVRHCELEAQLTGHLVATARTRPLATVRRSTDHRQWREAVRRSMTCRHWFALNCSRPEFLLR